jgi:hypothetical protein
MTFAHSRTLPQGVPYTSTPTVSGAATSVCMRDSVSTYVAVYAYTQANLWTISPMTLLEGLQFNEQTGAISGSCTAYAAPKTYTIKATSGDAKGTVLATIACTGSLCWTCTFVSVSHVCCCVSHAAVVCGSCCSHCRSNLLRVRLVRSRERYGDHF